MSSDRQLFDYLLRLADNALVLSQRLGEWIGHGPVLEEDIALTNVGLDLLGQARLWYAYAGEVDARIGEIAAKSLKEVTYHVERSTDWVIRLGDGTEESQAKMQAAIDELWMYTGEMFDADDTDIALAEAGIGCDVRALAEPWRNAV